MLWLILIKNVEVYAPEYNGRKDVFISGGKISLIEDEINFENDKIKIIDGSKKKITPVIVTVGN